jgi:hypothetical protein
MPEPSMVERIARAIYKANPCPRSKVNPDPETMSERPLIYDGDYSYDEAYPAWRNNAMKAAEAVLTALQPPTPAMVEAGADALKRNWADLCSADDLSVFARVANEIGTAMLTKAMEG